MWTIGIVIGVFVLLELAVIYGEPYLTRFLPNWKTEATAWGAMIFGMVVQLDPELFQPLFGDSKYTGLAIALLGILFRTLRQITFTPGSRVPEPIAAAAAAQTLIDTPKPELEKAVSRLVASPENTTKAENVVKNVIRNKRRGP